MLDLNEFVNWTKSSANVIAETGELTPMLFLLHGESYSICALANASGSQILLEGVREILARPPFETPSVQAFVLVFEAWTATPSAVKSYRDAHSRPDARVDALPLDDRSEAITIIYSVRSDKNTRMIGAKIARVGDKRVIEPFSQEGEFASIDRSTGKPVPINLWPG